MFLQGLLVTLVILPHMWAIFSFGVYQALIPELLRPNHPNHITLVSMYFKTLSYSKLSNDLSVIYPLQSSDSQNQI